MTKSTALATASRGAIAKRYEERVDHKAVKALLSEATGVEIDTFFSKPLPIEVRLTVAIKLAAKKYMMEFGEEPTLKDLLKKPQGSNEEPLMITALKWDRDVKRRIRKPVFAADEIKEQMGALYLDKVSDASGSDVVYTVLLPLFNYGTSPARRPLEEAIESLHTAAPRGCKPIKCQIKWVGMQDEALMQQIFDDAAQKSQKSDQPVEEAQPA